MGFNIMNMLGNFGAVKSAAPELLSNFLDKLLEDNKPSLIPENGEKQIFYIMFPKNGKYIISIVAANEQDTIVRSLRSIPLDDALSTILSEIK